VLWWFEVLKFESKMTKENQIAQAIRTAIKQGDLNQVRSLLGADPARANMMTVFGTWLHVAASFGKLEIVKYLVDEGADLNRNGGILGGAAIKDAASEGQIEIVKYLLARGAKLDVSSMKKNPLFGAIYGGHIEVVKLLIASGIDANVKYHSRHRNDWDAVAFAKERGQLEIAALLGASPESLVKESKRDAARQTSAIRIAGPELEKELREWLKRERLELLDSLKVAIRKHLANLRPRYPDLYGYALLPEDACEVQYINAAWNWKSNIKKNTVYYRYSVDEWPQDYEMLKPVHSLLSDLNRQFEELHPERERDDLLYDDYEIAHRQAYHDVFLKALLELKGEGVFNFAKAEPYLAIWIPDSTHKIMGVSVMALNSPAVVNEYASEFGKVAE
jgi:hypothetical protein